LLTTVYLHVFEWPAGGALSLAGLRSAVKKATLVDGGASVQVQTGAGGAGSTVLTGPATAPDAIDTVIRLELE